MDKNLDSKKIKLITKPLKFTVNELKTVFEEYFNSTNQEHWTVTGLALAMGSKQLLSDYCAREDYKDLIKHAKLLVEHGYEYQMRTDCNAGVIFALKQFGWSDKQEVKLETDISSKEEMQNELDEIKTLLKELGVNESSNTPKD